MAGRRGPACGGNRRDLHRQCRAPGFPGRRGGEDHRRRAPADGARFGRPRGGRGRAGGRGAGGLAGPAGPRPHLPGRPGGGGAGRLVPDGKPVGAARACPAVAGRRAGRRPAAAPSRWRRSRQRSGPGAGGGRAQRWPGGRDSDPPGGPDRRPVRRGPAGGARRPAWPPGRLRPGRARRPAPAGRVGRRHLPPARRRGHPGGAAGLRPRAQRHPAGAWRHPPHLADRAAARSQHQIAGNPPRRRTRRAHRHLHTHRQRRARPRRVDPSRKENSDDTAELRREP